jgi:hypothetical protein
MEASPIGSDGLTTPPAPADPVPDSVEFSRTDTLLWIVVPYTTPELTRAALKAAAGFGQGLDVAVRLIDVHMVPYPCDIDQPIVNSEHLKERLRKAACQCDLPIRAEVVYARDRDEGFHQVLRSRSLILLASRKRWWRTAEEKLARTLRRAGHKVTLLAV